jgi:hypothetical protein
MKAIIIITFLLFFQAQSAAIEVDTNFFRCESGEIARRGDTKTQILLKCGEPISSRVSHVTYRKSPYSENVVETPVEDWIYFGKNGFIYNVRFAGNNVLRITNEGR